MNIFKDANNSLKSRAVRLIRLPLTYPWHAFHPSYSYHWIFIKKFNWSLRAENLCIFLLSREIERSWVRRTQRETSFDWTSLQFMLNFAPISERLSYPTQSSFDFLATHSQCATFSIKRDSFLSFACPFFRADRQLFWPLAAHSTHTDERWWPNRDAYCSSITIAS